MSMSGEPGASTKLLNVLGFTDLWQPVPVSSRKLSATVNEASHRLFLGQTGIVKLSELLFKDKLNAMLLAQRFATQFPDQQIYG